MWMRVGLQRGTPQGEDKQRRDRERERKGECARARVPSTREEDYYLLVIEMQREVISGLSLGQLPFCSLRFPPLPTPPFKIPPPASVHLSNVLTSLAIITPLYPPPD